MVTYISFYTYCVSQESCLSLVWSLGQISETDEVRAKDPSEGRDNKRLKIILFFPSISRNPEVVSKKNFLKNKVWSNDDFS